jgi:hypothetical protein
MTKWKSNAFLIRGDSLKRTLGNTAAKLQETPIFPKHSNYIVFKRRETPLEVTSTATDALTVRKPQFSYPSSNLYARNWFHSLPSQRFHALLTLFPKFFSPFPHGTCLLSVLDRYLALGENYLPFSAPFPKYATLWTPTVREYFPAIRDSHPLWCFFPKRLSRKQTLVKRLKTTILKQALDLHVELFPVRSPLLGESYSFSFPPLTYMLKFSG